MFRLVYERGKIAIIYKVTPLEEPFDGKYFQCKVPQIIKIGDVEHEKTNVLEAFSLKAFSAFKKDIMRRFATFTLEETTLLWKNKTNILNGIKNLERVILVERLDPSLEVKPPKEESKEDGSDTTNVVKPQKKKW